VEVSVPVVGGGFKIGKSGSYCHAIVRVVDGKVAELNYTGDNDDFVGKEGVCAPIVRGCLSGRERVSCVKSVPNRSREDNDGDLLRAGKLH